MKKAFPLMLAIDTSCDDTSAAVTCGREVWSNVIASQTQLHKEFGGVFPTVAKQAHRENIEPVVQLALKRARVQLSDLAAVAVTQGPGLAPALEVGIEFAKNLATQLSVPLLAINHIEGHALSVLAHRKAAATAKKPTQPFPEPTFPVLALVISGGHSEFIQVNQFGSYDRLGFKIDDAAGEALDKFGRMVNLGYPAGQIIEEFAHHGNPHQYQFPLPMTTSGNFNLSFSGLKTSARNLIDAEQAKHPLTQQHIYDLCASFQYSVFRAITYKLGKILEQKKFSEVWLGGGVAANLALREAIRHTIKPYDLKLRVPYDRRLCSDNAAMIGIAAGYQFQRGKVATTPSEINAVERLPRWHIDEV